MEAQELKLLKNFTDNERGHAVNLLLKPMREGVTGYYDLYHYILGHCQEKLSWGNETCKKMIEAISDSDALIEAEKFYIEWEKLSHAEKEKKKIARAKVFIERDMQAKLPTEKQLSYLRNLGVKEIPIDRLSASKLIDSLINGRN